MANRRPVATHKLRNVTLAPLCKRMFDLVGHYADRGRPPVLNPPFPISDNTAPPATPNPRTQEMEMCFYKGKEFDFPRC